MNNRALFRELERELRREPGFCTNEGVLIRNAIAEAAMELRPELLRLLLGHAELRSFFFTEVAQGENSIFMLLKCISPFLNVILELQEKMK